MTHQYHVTGITCAGCEKKVKNALKTNPQIKDVQIDRTTETVSIEMEQHITVEALKEALAGYPKYQLSAK
jgi:copper chaperone CopZ